MNEYKLVPVELIDRIPEINPSNYGHDDVCALNAWAVEVVLASVAAPAVQGEPDVTALVEALSESLKGIKIPSVLTPARAEFFKAGVHAAVNQLNTVLAAHRKQGGEV